MTTLLENYSPSHSVVIVNYKSKNYGLMKFKLWVSNDNSYCNAGIDNFSKNGEFITVFNRYDIPNFKYVSYICNAEERIKDSKYDIELMKKLIETVF